jgi:hypothetical protein
MRTDETSAAGDEHSHDEPASLPGEILQKNGSEREKAF